ncbi:conserved hypothetical protein [Candidatus Methylobacter favarea]|uniref:Uncharacterized protein n=1 Tax=Candidatus Methylobacter favarea TaxID=2707345 RepID=A0A8S0WIU7_9GAMM|nr:hypothetical protein [Candidatus Methylobacter favarea]CAA9890794.1 conserved hypothetical protein [Candidatus Methylobacter favarea]
MSVITDVEVLADQLPALIAAQKAELMVKQNEMNALKQAGLIYANEHWRSGKYLYLIYPSKDGQRERKYVGADPAKIDEAKASIRRAKEYDRLAAELMVIEQALLNGRMRLRDAVSCLSGKRQW